MYKVLDTNGNQLGCMPIHHFDSRTLKIATMSELPMRGIDDDIPDDFKIHTFEVEKCFDFYVLVNGDPRTVVDHLKKYKDTK